MLEHGDHGEVRDEYRPQEVAVDYLVEVAAQDGAAVAVGPVERPPREPFDLLVARQPQRRRGRAGGRLGAAAGEHGHDRGGKGTVGRLVCAPLTLEIRLRSAKEAPSGGADNIT